MMEYFAVVFIFFALLFDRLNIFFYVLISSILHEAGHIVACVLFKIKPVIKLSLFGIKLCTYPAQRSKKLCVVLAGPFINLISAIISYSFLMEKYSLQMYVFFAVNTIILCFNMLPINFLDGGQVLNIVCDNIKVRKMADILSFLFILVVVFILSENIICSLAAVMIFAIYYLITVRNTADF